jgi:hypothetical protein
MKTRALVYCIYTKGFHNVNYVNDTTLCYNDVTVAHFCMDAAVKLSKLHATSLHGIN